MNRRTWKRSAAAACSVAALALAGCSAAEPSAAPGADDGAGPSATPSASPSPTPSPADDASPDASGGASVAPDRDAGGPGRQGEATESPRARRTGGNGGNAAPSTGAGRRYLRSQSAVLARLPGSDSGQCVSVGDQRDVRSGGIAAGPFDTAREGYGTAIQPGMSRRTVRLYWIPEHSADMSGLTIRMQRLQPESAATHTIRQQRWADTDQWRFYDTNLEFPSAGTWRLRVTAGQDGGCFDLTMDG